jgi:uncharacterized membrane protein
MLYDRRTLVVAFVVSLLINLFLAGVVAGHYLMHNSYGPGAILVRNAARTLPDKERQHFVAVMRAQIPAMRASRAKIRDLRHQVRDAIAAPHYDAGLLAQRFAALRDASMAQQTLQQNALVQALGQLSPQSRSSIIAAARDSNANR